MSAEIVSPSAATSERLFVNPWSGVGIRTITAIRSFLSVLWTQVCLLGLHGAEHCFFKRSQRRFDPRRRADLRRDCLDGLEAIARYTDDDRLVAGYPSLLDQLSGDRQGDPA